MSDVRGYSDVENVWSPLARELLGKVFLVQEKLDGSQFAIFAGSARSKRKPLLLSDDDPDLFLPAVRWVKQHADQIPDDLIIHGEAIAKPRHNALTYGRAPEAGFIVFDIETYAGTWLRSDQCRELCGKLGLEYVQVFAEAMTLTMWSDLEQFLDRDSMLGGPIEGVVAKPLDRSVLDPHSKRPVLVKVVRPEFREKNNKAQKEFKTSQSLDAKLGDIVESYRTEARWVKAAQRLRDEGKLEGKLQDIPKLIAEAADDVIREEENAIKEFLWAAAQKQIRRRLAAGLPEWYKGYLQQ